MLIPFAGPHFQTNRVRDWPQAIRQFPETTWVKAIDNVQLLDEARRNNPGLNTVLRHFDGGWQNFNLGTLSAYKEHARKFFASFVDGTFEQYAHHVDAVEGLNEYNASSHSEEEKHERILWAQAACMVWDESFRSKPGLEHIRLVVGNVAVGNDMPVETARAVADYGAIAGYHPYVAFRKPEQQTFAGVTSLQPPGRRRSFTATRAKLRPGLYGEPEDGPYALDVATYEEPFAAYGQIEGQVDAQGVMPDEWPWLSGRWTTMDAQFRAQGIFVEWLGTEAGPIGYYDWGGLDPMGGWRHPDVCDGDIGLCLSAIDYWMDRSAEWNARNGNRMLGKVLFNSGGTSEWNYFEYQTPALEAVAHFMVNYEPPVVDEPDPEPEPRRYRKKGHLVKQDLQRGQFDAVMDVAWPQRNSVFFSADDWALTLVSKLVEITGRDLTVWDVADIIGAPEEEAKAKLEQWLQTYYPQPAPALTYRRIEELFLADTWDSPVGTQEERASGEIWPGEWTDANPFGNRYKLGNAYFFHPASDLNLNSPTWDLDRNMPVWASASGQVVFAGIPSRAWQGVVVIRHKEPDGSVSYTRNAHLGQIFVTDGQWLKRGTLIGTTGRNITDEGPGPFHLHTEVCVTDLVARDPGYWPPAENLQVVEENWVDPREWIAARHKNF